MDGIPKGLFADGRKIRKLGEQKVRLAKIGEAGARDHYFPDG